MIIVSATNFVAVFTVFINLLGGTGDPSFSTSLFRLFPATTAANALSGPHFRPVSPAFLAK